MSLRNMVHSIDVQPTMEQAHIDRLKKGWRKRAAQMQKEFRNKTKQYFIGGWGGGDLAWHDMTHSALANVIKTNLNTILFSQKSLFRLYGT